MTHQYMAGYPPVEPAPGAAFQGGSPNRSGSYGSPQDMYSYPPPPPVHDQAAYGGPPSRMGSYSQPGFDPYAQQQMGGQLAPYNPQAPIAANGTLLPPAIAPDGTFLPPAMAPDGTFLPPARHRTYSTDSRRSHHSNHSHRSSRSTRSRREVEVERRPSWADSLIAMWDALKGAFDKRKV